LTIAVPGAEIFIELLWKMLYEFRVVQQVRVTLAEYITCISQHRYLSSALCQ